MSEQRTPEEVDNLRGRLVRERTALRIAEVVLVGLMVVIGFYLMDALGWIELGPWDRVVLLVWSVGMPLFGRWVTKRKLKV